MKNIFFIVLFAGLYCSGQGVKPLDAQLSGYNYPFPVSYFSINAQRQQLKIAYMDIPADAAAGSATRTVLLLHGKNFSGAYWEQTARDLSKKGFRVIIPDQPGFGKSSKPEHFQYTFQVLAQSTMALLDSLKIHTMAVIGHSMGGMLAIRFALMYPERVNALILEDPIGLEDWKLKVPYQSIDKWYAAELKQDYEKIKKYQLDNYYAGVWKPEYDKWVNLQAGMVTGPDREKIAWSSALTYDMIFTQPVIYEISHLQPRTLLIIGQKDRTALGRDRAPDSLKAGMGNYPVLGKQVAAMISNAKLVELPNSGHLPHIQEYDLFISEVLKFLGDMQEH